MSFYTKLQATATKLLTSKGQLCTLRKQTSGAYNPATGTSTQTTADTFIVGVLLNYNKSLTSQPDSLVLATDRKAIIQGTVNPDVDDLLIFNSVSYRIVAVKTLNPAGTTVISECQVRI